MKPSDPRPVGLLLRVEIRSGGTRIRCQELRSGERREFRDWHDFVRYASALVRPGGLG